MDNLSQNATPAASMRKRRKEDDAAAADTAADTAASLPDPRCLAAVEDFHRMVKSPLVATPALPDRARQELRLSLLAEELQELRDALRTGDLVEAADALADLQYVLSGTVLELGMGGCFKDLFDEVHRSNMTKRCPSADDAAKTVAHYLARDGTVAHAEADPAVPGSFLVYRTSDHKALKSVNFSEPALAGVLVAAGADEAACAGPTRPDAA